MFLCYCGEAHDSAVQGYCLTRANVALVPAGCVQVTTLDADSITLAIALLQEIRRGVADNEFHGRLAVAEDVLTRIVREALAASPVAQVALTTNLNARAARGGK